MVNIILASNMTYLTDQWDTDRTGISFIISGIGMGKLISYTLFGHLSDKFGRKPLILFATLAMMVFLIGTPLSGSYQIAFVLAVVAGLGNAAMDASAYPGLIEIFPKSAGSASVLVKGFISVGATLLPLMILFFADRNMFYGYAFFIPAAIYLLNMLLLLRASFPAVNSQDHVKNREEEIKLQQRFKSKPIFRKEGFVLILIGFTSTGLFTVSQIWLPTYGEEAVGMTAASAIKLLSYYSFGALFSVLVLFVLLNRVLKPITVMIIYPIISLLSITTILTIKIPLVTSITSFFVGFSTAGIFQLAITVLTEFFWEKKGTMTGALATAGSIAAIVMPLLTGWLAKSGNISHIFIFDAFLSAIGFIAACYVYYRYKKVFVLNKKGETSGQNRLILK
jgi:MFS family permease